MNTPEEIRNEIASLKAQLALTQERLIEACEKGMDLLANRQRELQSSHRAGFEECQRMAAEDNKVLKELCEAALDLKHWCMFTHKHVPSGWEKFDQARQKYRDFVIQNALKSSLEPSEVKCWPCEHIIYNTNFGFTFITNLN